MAWNFGEYIKANRKRLGMTVNAFAASLGVSRATQMNYEASKTEPTLSYLKRCERLGVPVSSLLQEGAVTERCDLSQSDQLEVEIFRLISEIKPSSLSIEERTKLFEGLLRILRGCKS